MKQLEQLTNEYNSLRSKVLSLCYQLPYPHKFKEYISIEMIDRGTEDIVGINEDGYLYNEDGNVFEFADDVVGAGELLYLLENI